jgi:hypothetical protein
MGKGIGNATNPRPGPVGGKSEAKRDVRIFLPNLGDFPSSYSQGREDVAARGI